MNIKKTLSGVVGILLVTAMIAVLAGCASMEQRVISGWKKLQDAKAAQVHIVMDTTVGMDMMGVKQDMLMKMAMDVTGSGEDSATKGTISSSVIGEELQLESYVKDGFAYVKTSGQTKYTKTPLTAAQSVNTTDQYIKALKSVDLTQAEFTFEKAAVDVDGKSVQAEKVKVTLPDDQANQMMQSLVTDALKNAGDGANMGAVESLFKGMTVQNFSLTLYLSGDNIIREDVRMKMDFDLGKMAESLGTSGLEGSMSMDIDMQMTVVKLADTLPIDFPEFNESNTVEQ